MHCVCNQVRGTVHGRLPDRSNQVGVHVSCDRNRGVPSSFDTVEMSAPPASIRLAAECRSPWKLNSGSGSPCSLIFWNSRVMYCGSGARPSSMVNTVPLRLPGLLSGLSFSSLL